MTDTMTNLPPVSISSHNKRTFDELSHQCNAVLHSSNSPLSTIGINNKNSLSHLMPTTMNDYERRFQRSLQKLTIPTWYTETIPSSKLLTTSKQSIVSSTTTTTIPWKNNFRESSQTPEIIHIRRPHSYRSCRSSLATSPSPSIHSWHPNHMLDGMNFSFAIPSSLSSSTRRQNKYQKGIERVSKSSRWYQPTSFMTSRSNKNQTSIIKVSTATKQNHYDIPKISAVNDENIRSLNVDKKEENNQMNSIVQQQDNQIQSDASEQTPIVNHEEPFGQIELEERTIDKINEEFSLERAANDLVQSILADILLLKSLDDSDDQNSGVRELSDDETGLRELDENDMNDTDEFIVFAAQTETSDDNNPQYHTNKIYTFSKSTSSNQNSPRSVIENDVIAIPLSTIETLPTSPISHAQNSDFDTFVDRLMDSTYSPLVTNQSCQEINEETARIARILLDQTSIPLHETSANLFSTSIFTNNQLIISEDEDYPLPIIEEYDHESYDQVRRDSAYSSNQERIHIPHSAYEPLSECYSGYSFVQSDFLTPNVSFIQSTTDEAYESEPTTMSSSLAITCHVHPELEHEFEYPSPPPPVPDRRLKPTYLKSSSPPLAPSSVTTTTKPRSNKSEHIDSTDYGIIHKSKPFCLPTIEQFFRSNSNDSTSVSKRTLSSRHYCGLIPTLNEQQTTVSPMKVNEHSKEKIKEKRINRTLNCLHPSTTDDNHSKRNLTSKSSSPSTSNKTKMKKSKLTTEFDEATNGLAIRLLAPVPDDYSSNKSSNRNRTSTPITTKRSMTTKRTSFYETSV